MVEGVPACWQTLRPGRRCEVVVSTTPGPVGAGLAGVSPPVAARGRLDLCEAGGAERIRG